MATPLVDVLLVLIGLTVVVLLLFGIRAHLRIVTVMSEELFSDWARSGPIIEQERINLQFDPDPYPWTGEPCWRASYATFWSIDESQSNEPEFRAPTPLAAARLCYFARKEREKI